MFTSKVLLALRLVFSVPYAVPYAIALDAEVEFLTDQPFLSYFPAWRSARRMVVTRIPKRPTAHSLTAESFTIARCSCNLVRGAEMDDSTQHQHRSSYGWFNDAPVFSRDDYEDFFQRLRWDRLSWFAYHQEAYICYKRLVRDWGVLEVDAYLGYHQSEEQRHYAPNYTFLWTRSTDPTRLIRFHLDQIRVHCTNGLSPCIGRTHSHNIIDYMVSKSECTKRAESEGYDVRTHKDILKRRAQ